MFGKLFNNLKSGLTKTRNALTDKNKWSFKFSSNYWWWFIWGIRRNTYNGWYRYGYYYGNYR